MSHKYIVAVSGGVDSVVLLDMLVQQAKGTSAQHEPQGEGLTPPEAIIVAHFDHGIRPDSAADARFVAGLARSYGLRYETERQELGARASEDLARTRRYQFLRRLARQYQAKIVTAHHADDALETIAINLTRGTGWRGLAALAAADIERPLLDMRKVQIYDYALDNRLEWVEDSTNQEDRYLRNRLRRQLSRYLPVPAAGELMDLFKRQRQLKGLIESEIVRLMQAGPQYDRYDLIQIEASLALEILGSIIQVEAGFRPTRPQLDRALLAIKTAKSGDQHQISRGARLDFKQREFFVQTD